MNKSIERGMGRLHSALRVAARIQPEPNEQVWSRDMSATRPHATITRNNVFLSTKSFRKLSTPIIESQPYYLYSFLQLIPLLAHDFTRFLFGENLPKK